MAAERDAFGFYFSSHPVEGSRHLLAAHKVRTFADILQTEVAEGERVGASMAALVEDARWRTSAKGRRYMMASLSDSTGQFIATAFDDEVTAALESAAKAGQCGLLGVELDRRAGDDSPRVTVKRFQALSDLARHTRLQMTVRVPNGAAAARAAALLDQARGSNGLVRFIVAMASGGEAILVAGRDYALDGELAARIEHVTGEGSVDLSVQEVPKLALVG
jgi:DNA polymerase-3 subunit alpha